MIPETERISDERLKTYIKILEGGRVPIVKGTTAALTLALRELESLRAKIEEQERELVRLREGWVSVKDRLPDENVEVLCCRPDEEAWIDYWETFADGPEWSAECETRIPTHWMPLPAPPVMEKQGVVDVTLASSAYIGHSATHWTDEEAKNFSQLSSEEQPKPTADLIRAVNIPKVEEL